MKFRFSIILPLLIIVPNVAIILLLLVGDRYLAMGAYLMINSPLILFIVWLNGLTKIPSYLIYVLPAIITIFIFFIVGLFIDKAIIEQKKINKKAKITSRDPDEFPR